MPKKPTADDARLILKLYDLRRESELRKARSFIGGQFWPDTIDDYNKIASAMGTQENAWLRQAMGYWELSASLVNHGALNADLFLEPSFSAEMFLIYSKMKPFIKELREKSSPTFLLNVEKLVNSSKKSREFQARMEKNLVARRKAMAAKSN
jgi:hypothetical protein